ncbi:threonyl-tRNA synthetase, partial [Cryomyces antarcticus]
HYAGRWPCWLSPRPAIILTVNDDPAVTAYAEAVRTELSGRAQTPQSSSHNKALPQQPGFTELPIDIDTSARSLGRKVHEAKEKKYNHIVVVGPKDVEADTVQVELQAQPDREVALTTLKQVIGVMKDQLPTEGKPLKLEMKRTQALQYLQELVKNFA